MVASFAKNRWSFDWNCHPRSVHPPEGMLQASRPDTFAFRAASFFLLLK
jgi:hypothetical protein